MARSDAEMVAELIGRRPKAEFDVVVRGADDWPVVIRNAPLMDDGTPMPTLYYLVDPDLLRRIGTLEAEGGVKEAERSVDTSALDRAHETYASERDLQIPEDHEGPRPYGGVGGTRRGVKCLHAHYAYFLAGGEDPVGQWVQDRLVGGPSPSEDDGDG